MGAAESTFSDTHQQQHSEDLLWRNENITKVSKSNGWLYKFFSSRESDPPPHKKRLSVTRTKIRKKQHEHPIISLKNVDDKREAVSTCSTLTAATDNESTSHTRDDSCFHRVFPRTVQGGTNIINGNGQFSTENRSLSRTRACTAHPMPPKVITTRFQTYRSISKTSSRHISRVRARSKSSCLVKPSMSHNKAVPHRVEEKIKIPRTHSDKSRLSNHHSIAIQNRLQFLHSHASRDLSTNLSFSELSLQDDVHLEKNSSSLMITSSSDPTCNQGKRQSSIVEHSTQESAILNRVCAAVLKDHVEKPVNEPVLDASTSCVLDDFTRSNARAKADHTKAHNQVQSNCSESDIKHTSPQHDGHKTSTASCCSVASKSEVSSVSDSHHSSRHRAAVDCPPRKRVESNDGIVVLSEEEDEFHSFMREKMYSRATWNMYDRITRARAVKVQASIANNRVPNPVTMPNGRNISSIVNDDRDSPIGDSTGIQDISNDALFPLDLNE